MSKGTEPDPLAIGQQPTGYIVYLDGEQEQQCGMGEDTTIAHLNYRPVRSQKLRCGLSECEVKALFVVLLLNVCKKDPVDLSR